MAISWQFCGLRGCYGIYVPLFFAEIALRGSLIRDRFTWRCDRGIGWYRQLRARRALMQCSIKDVPLRTRKVLFLYKVYGDSALLVLNRTSRRVSAKRPLGPNLCRLVKKKSAIHGHLLSRYDQVPVWIFSLKMCSSPISTSDICSLCEVVRAFLHQRDSLNGESAILAVNRRYNVLILQESSTIEHFVVFFLTNTTFCRMNLSNETIATKS